MELAVRSLTIFLGIFLGFLVNSAVFAKPSAGYLPADAKLGTSIPSPEAQLGCGFSGILQVGKRKFCKANVD